MLDIGGVRCGERSKGKRTQAPVERQADEVVVVVVVVGLVEWSSV